MRVWKKKEGSSATTRREGSEMSSSRSTLREGLGVMVCERFRGGLVFKAHRLLYHTTLGWRVIKKKMMRKIDR